MILRLLPRWLLGVVAATAFAFESVAVDPPKAVGETPAGGNPDPAALDTRENSPVEKLAWVNGPATARLKDLATIRLPAGFRFLDHSDARKLLELTGNRTHGDEVGLIEQKADRWWVVFKFDDIGFVKDDEKNELDADKLLESIHKGTEAANEYRAEKGVPPLHVVGWHVKPNYNDQTKNLEWAIIAESQGQQSVNYNVRVLGRHGVTAVTLVDELEHLDKALPEFRELLKEFHYSTGQSYAEYRQGDKIAKVGLGALVVGGAAAAAYKLGFFGAFAAFFKKFFKLVIVGIVAAAAAIKNFFARLFGRGPKTRPDHISAP
jgi:uncharacterized membrane-anchored protein